MNQQKIIITINRECGSGGGEIHAYLARSWVLRFTTAPF